ncbi:MAG: hypothetical protein HZB42_05730 [Sphingobacteriales bacterium]|nr:hypothetical protein [Sphingobacteriales bacterium]
MDFDFKEQLKAKTDQELIDIYVNQDGFQENFVSAAIEELQLRKINIEEFRKEKELNEIRGLEKKFTGIPGNSVYITLAFISAFLGGIIGIIAGYVYSQSKKEGYYVYDAKTRGYGKIMFIIGIFVLAGTIAWRLDHK